MPPTVSAMLWYMYAALLIYLKISGVSSVSFPYLQIYCYLCTRNCKPQGNSPSKRCVG